MERGEVGHCREPVEAQRLIQVLVDVCQDPVKACGVFGPAILRHGEAVGQGILTAWDGSGVRYAGATM